MGNFDGVKDNDGIPRRNSGAKDFVRNFLPPRQNSRRIHPPPESEAKVKIDVQNSAKEIIDEPKETEPVEKEVEEIIQELEKDGSHLWKIRASSFRKKSHRKFILDQAKTIRYEHTDQHSTDCFGRKNKNVDVSEIYDVRRGWKTDAFNQFGRTESRNLFRRRRDTAAGPKVQENNCFSIIYGPQRITLDLMAPSDHEADKWVRALQHLISSRPKEANLEESYEKWLRKQFNGADVDKNKSLNFTETLKLLKRLNLSMEEDEVRKRFDEANELKTNEKRPWGNIKRPSFLSKVGLGGGATTEEVLDENEFVKFYFKLLQRPEIDTIISKFAKSDEFLEPEELLNFLNQEQENKVTLDQVKNMIQNFEPILKGGQMGSAGLSNLLMSPQGDIFNGKHRVVYQNMTLPLCNYFIATSHNTYLMGNQLSGNSSVEGYIDALKRGCRCVELDCWDGDDDEIEPVIYHGYTLTTKILFKDVLSDAIVPYAFSTSPYPLILNVENHCSAPFQQKMVHHLKTILGPKLYTQFDPDLTQLPSPEELKEMIIVRGKRPKETLGEESESEDSDGDVKVKSKNVKPRSGTDESISGVINILQNSHFHTFQESKVTMRPYHTTSITESKALKLVEGEGRDFVDFNRRQITRIYPAGSRTGSSNFNPILFWTVGCQLVALNYQTEDTPNFYNHVKFSENGRCGFVLKPKILREGLHKGSNSGLILNLRIISAQHLPKAEGSSEVVDPYVKVKVTGLQQDKRKYTSQIVSNNGFNPVWDEEWETQVDCPDLALLIFKVYDYAQTGTDEPLGQYGIPFSALSSGYRHLHLMSKRGEVLFPSTLFVHVKLTGME